MPHILIKHPALKGISKDATWWFAPQLPSPVLYNINAKHKLLSQAIKEDYMKHLAQPTGYVGLVFQFCSITLSLSSTGKQKPSFYFLPFTARFCSPNNNHLSLAHRLGLLISR